MTRDLTELEFALLARIFDDDATGVEAARLQLPHTLHAGMSHGEDMCFELEVDGDVPVIDQPPENRPMFGSMVYDGAECVGEIDIWVDGGRLSSFEYSWFTDDAPTALPTVQQLRTLPRPGYVPATIPTARHFPRWFLGLRAH